MGRNTTLCMDVIGGRVLYSPRKGQNDWTYVMSYWSILSISLSAPHVHVYSYSIQCCCWSNEQLTPSGQAASLIAIKLLGFLIRPSWILFRD